MIKYWQIIALVLIMFIALQPSLDLDLGWHLRYGEYFFQTGHVLKTNILSSVWPDYKWVQASWGFDLIEYQLYHHLDFLGLSVFVAIITVITFTIVIFPIRRLSIISLIILAVVFLTQTNQMYIAGLRSQTLSTLFFALTLIISSSYLSSRPLSLSSRRMPGSINSIYLLPVLFWIWANLHGGFFLGLIIITILWLGFGALKLIPKKPWLIFGLILLFSFLTPLINPWGSRIYEESFKHSSNTNLILIKEWQPFTKWPTEATVTALLTALVVILGIIRRKLSDIPFLLVLILVTYLAFSALRFITILGVVLTFYLSVILSETKDITIFFSRIKYGINMTIFRRILAGIFAGLFILDLLFVQKFVQLPSLSLFNYSWSAYCQNLLNCSEELTALMIKNPPKGAGFNPYGMGGYLIFRVPQVKVFVDGRMAAWEEEGQTPPILEVAANGSKDSPILFRKLDSQYHFSWVIIETGTPIAKYLDQLVKNGAWEKPYQDTFYSYYVLIIQPQSKLEKFDHL